MTTDKLSDLFGQIDPAYLEETDRLRQQGNIRPFSSRRKYLYRSLAAAAALVLVVGVTSRFAPTGKSSSLGTNDSAGMESAGMESAAQEPAAEENDITKDIAMETVEEAADEAPAQVGWGTKSEAVSDASANAGAASIDAGEAYRFTVRVESLTEEGFIGSLTGDYAELSLVSGEKIQIIIDTPTESPMEITEGMTLWIHYYDYVYSEETDELYTFYADDITVSEEE